MWALFNPRAYCGVHLQTRSLTPIEIAQVRQGLLKADQVDASALPSEFTELAPGRVTASPTLEGGKSFWLRWSARANSAMRGLMASLSCVVTSSCTSLMVRGAGCPASVRAG